MNSQVSLYDEKTIDTLALPNSEVARLAEKFLKPLIKNKACQFINNVNTQLLALTIDDLVLPVTVNDYQLNNSYVCSPYTHYITYAKEELPKLNNSLLEKALEKLLTFMGGLLRIGEINKVVIVNNWLVSTNLYPKLSKKQVLEIRDFLIKRFPHHAIVFRSVNTFDSCELFAILQECGYRMVASRQIYFLNPQYDSSIRGKTKWLLKKDFKLLSQGGYEVVDGEQLSQADVPRLTELYQALYLEKYSYKNPQFNENFIELALKEKTLTIKALQKDGKIDGVLGFYELNGVMTTPLLGYDTSLPQKTGLYRMLSAQIVIEATQRKLLLNQSSGAAEFKRCRGGVGNVEYNAVFYQHLPFYRQLTWLILELLVNKIGIPILQKLKL